MRWSPVSLCVAEVFQNEVGSFQPADHQPCVLPTLISSCCIQGVSWSSSCHKWAAVIWDRLSKKARHVGVYGSEEEAARAYDREVITAQGAKNTGLNFRNSECSHGWTAGQLRTSWIKTSACGPCPMNPCIWQHTPGCCMLVSQLAMHTGTVHLQVLMKMISCLTAAAYHHLYV